MTGDFGFGLTIGFFFGVAAVLVGSFVGRFIGHGRAEDDYGNLGDAQ